MRKKFENEATSWKINEMPIVCSPTFIAGTAGVGSYIDLGVLVLFRNFLGTQKPGIRIWVEYDQKSSKDFFSSYKKKNHFLIFGHIDDFSKLHSTVQHSCMLHFFKKSSSFAFNQYSLGARNLGFRYCTTKQSPKYFPFYCMKRGRLLLRLLFKVFWRVKEV